MANKIFIVTGEHPDKCIGGAELQAYLIAKNISSYFDKTYFVTVFSGESFIKEENGIIHISLKKQFLPLKIFKFLIKIIKYKPDIIYVRCLYSFWWIKIISYLLIKKTVFHLSGDSQAKYWSYNNFFRLSQYIKNFYLWWIRYADLLISQTKYQANLLNENFSLSSKIIYNAQKVVNNSEYKNFGKKITLLWIGKSFKNPKKFIELANLFKKNNKYEFLMIGMMTFDQEKEFKKIEEQLNNFKFLGQLKREEVYEILNKAHVLINTSDGEGFPNTFIEAWHRGVIVISDKINPDSVITKYEIGFLCPSIEDMREKIIQIFEKNPELAEEYTHRAIQYAREHHNIEKTAFQIYKVVQSLLN